MYAEVDNLERPWTSKTFMPVTKKLLYTGARFAFYFSSYRITCFLSVCRRRRRLSVYYDKTANADIAGIVRFR